MNNVQFKVKDFCNKSKLIAPPEHCFIDLISELGEVGKELLKMSEYGRKPLKLNDHVREELGDAFYSLLTLANSLEVDLESELNKVIIKYEKRLLKGSAGSESDK